MTRACACGVPHARRFDERERDDQRRQPSASPIDSAKRQRVSRIRASSRRRRARLRRRGCSPSCRGRRCARTRLDGCCRAACSVSNKNDSDVPETRLDPKPHTMKPHEVAREVRREPPDDEHAALDEAGCDEQAFARVAVGEHAGRHFEHQRAARPHDEQHRQLERRDAVRAHHDRVHRDRSERLRAGSRTRTSAPRCVVSRSCRALWKELERVDAVVW